jgi:hypothetical protein
MAMSPTIAYFITPHGFGHASRAAAVMQALAGLAPGIRFELFTSCPQEIFTASLETDFGYHHTQTDIGLVQTSPLSEDLEATCRQLDHMLPFDPNLVDGLAGSILKLNCRLVICDIAPLGIAAARAAGLPSILVENFTWDWIYNGYLKAAPGLQPHVDYLSHIFRQADHHIQTRPLCRPVPGAVQTGPISRRARSPREQVRARLGIQGGDKMVLVSMGGVPDRFDFLCRLPEQIEPFLVIPGAGGRSSPHPKVRLLPTHSEFYHPDLMAAADALVAKAGYSTIAEAYQCGLPFCYVRRPQSPESDALEKFITRHLPTKTISPDSYADGTWINTLSDLLSMPRAVAQKENGAVHVAGMICRILESQPGWRSNEGRIAGEAR